MQKPLWRRCNWNTRRPPGGRWRRANRWRRRWLGCGCRCSWRPTGGSGTGWCDPPCTGIRAAVCRRSGKRPGDPTAGSHRNLNDWIKIYSNLKVKVVLPMKIREATPLVWMTSTKLASPGSKPTKAGVHSNNGPAGSNPVSILIELLWTFQIQVPRGDLPVILPKLATVLPA